MILAGASTIATDTAQVILMDSSLTNLISLFELAEKFDASMKSMLVSTVLPGVVTVTGVFFWHFGLIHSIILNQTGFAAGLSTTLLPARRLRKEQKQRALVQGQTQMALSKNTPE